MRVVGKIEAARHNTDDAIRVVFDAHRLIERGRSRAVALLPQRVADQRDATACALFFFFAREITAKRGIHFQCRLPALGSINHRDPLGLIAVEQRQVFSAQRDDTVENFVRLAQRGDDGAVHAE